MPNRTLILVALLATATLASFTANALAPPQPCQAPADDAPPTVIAAPFSQTTGWLPSCLIVPDGSAVTWLVAEVATHSVLFHGCYDSGFLIQGGVTDAVLTWDEAAGRVRVAPDASSPSVECATHDLDGVPVLREIDGGIEITYICEVHPLSMIGRVQLMTEA